MFSLYGWLDACIALDDVQDGGGIAIGELQVIETTLLDRNISTCSLLDYMKVRALRDRSSLPHAAEHILSSD
jgi:hypothetical protein